MYYYHYHYPLHPAYCLVIVACCLIILFISRKDSSTSTAATVPQPKRTIGGLVGLVAGVAVGLAKMILERFID